MKVTCKKENGRKIYRVNKAVNEKVKIAFYSFASGMLFMYLIVNLTLR